MMGRRARKSGEARAERVREVRTKMRGGEWENEWEARTKMNGRRWRKGCGK
jgi:hypothetical protein